MSKHLGLAQRTVLSVNNKVYRPSGELSTYNVELSCGHSRKRVMFYNAEVGKIHNPIGITSSCILCPMEYY